MKAIIDVADCRDCPFKYEHRGQGEGWIECSHKDSRKGYEGILWHNAFTETPDWCPLKEMAAKK